MGIIAELIEKFKGFDKKPISEDVFIVSVIILASLCSFALGRLSAEEDLGSGNEFQIEYDKAGEGIWETYETTGINNKSFVASKNGTKYYPIACNGADRIKEENRIYFETVEEAEGAGYSKTTTCGDF